MMRILVSISVILLCGVIRLAHTLRLSVPLLYVILAITVFRPWYVAHTVLAAGTIAEPDSAGIFTHSCPRKIGLSEFRKPDSWQGEISGLTMLSDPILQRGLLAILPKVLFQSSLITFRQCFRNVSARRRHWGQGISPASGILTSKCYACAIAAQGRRPWLNSKRYLYFSYSAISIAIYPFSLAIT